MTDKILLVYNTAGERQDRLAPKLAERGLETLACCPLEGDPLPAHDSPDIVGAVIYGGPASANDEGPQRPFIPLEVDWIRWWMERERPLLGICLGAQLLAKAMGAEVRRHPEGLHEIGYVPVEPMAPDFMPEPMKVYHWHNEGFDLPEGAELLAKGPVFPNQAYRMSPTVYGLQFHPETTVDQFTHWIDVSGDMLDEPGAQSREEQLSAAKRYDAPLEAWLDGFLDRWLSSIGIEARVPAD